MLTVLVPLTTSLVGTGKAIVRQDRPALSGYGHASVCECPLTTYVNVTGLLTARFAVSKTAEAFWTLVTFGTLSTCGDAGCTNQPRFRVPSLLCCRLSSTSFARSRASTGPSKPTFAQAKVCVPCVLNLLAL